MVVQVGWWPAGREEQLSQQYEASLDRRTLVYSSRLIFINPYLGVECEIPKKCQKVVKITTLICSKFKVGGGGIYETFCTLCICALQVLKYYTGFLTIWYTKALLQSLGQIRWPNESNGIYPRFKGFSSLGLWRPKICLIHLYTLHSTIWQFLRNC